MRIPEGANTEVRIPEGAELQGAELRGAESQGVESQRCGNPKVREIRGNHRKNVVLLVLFWHCLINY